MALTTKQRSKQLESLLDAIERGNKKDAADYTGGHLNESNLYNPPEFSTHKDWDGAKGGQLKLRKPSKIPLQTTKANLAKQGGMTDVLAQFSVGNDGFLPSVKKKRNRKLNRDKDYWGGEIDGSVDEKALIEEIDSRRFMLNRSQPPRLHKTWAMEDEDASPRSKTKSVPPKHEFYHLNSGATKRDQFRDFKLFETGTIRKQDALVSKVLSGDQGVLRVEQDLNKVSVLYFAITLYKYRLHVLTAFLQGLANLIKL